MEKKITPHPNTTWATRLLQLDHQRIQDLFGDFEQFIDPPIRSEIRNLTVEEIRIHRAMVHDIFIPAIRDAAQDPLVMQNVVEELEAWEPLLENVERLAVTDKPFLSAWQTLAATLAKHMEMGDQALIDASSTLPVDFIALGLRLIARRRELIAEMPVVPTKDPTDLSGA